MAAPMIRIHPPSPYFVEEVILEDNITKLLAPSPLSPAAIREKWEGVLLKTLEQDGINFALCQGNKGIEVTSLLGFEILLDLLTQPTYKDIHGFDLTGTILPEGAWKLFLDYLPKMSAIKGLFFSKISPQHLIDLVELGPDGLKGLKEFSCHYANCSTQELVLPLECLIAHTSLTVLDLSFCSLEAGDLQFLKGATDLKVLWLEDNECTEEIFNILDQCEKVEYLYIRDNVIEDPLPLLSLIEKGKLTYLELQGNAIEQDKMRAFLNGLSHLKKNAPLTLSLFPQLDYDLFFPHEIREWRSHFSRLGIVLKTPFRESDTMGFLFDSVVNYEEVKKVWSDIFLGSPPEADTVNLFSQQQLRMISTAGISGFMDAVIEDSHAFKIIRFGRCGFNASTWRVFCEKSTQLKTVSTLILEGCQVSSAMFLQLADAAPEFFAQLEGVIVRDNPFNPTEDLANAVIELLQRSSLKALALSNCHLEKETISRFFNGATGAKGRKRKREAFGSLSTLDLSNNAIDSLDWLASFPDTQALTLDLRGNRPLQEREECKRLKEAPFARRINPLYLLLGKEVDSEGLALAWELKKANINVEGYPEDVIAMVGEIEEGGETFTEKIHARQDAWNKALYLYLLSKSFTLYKVPEDHNCLFHCIGFFDGKGNVFYYRKMVVDYMREHVEEFLPFISEADYFDEMETTSKWGDHCELVAFSRMLKRPIYVYNPAYPLRMVDGFPQAHAHSTFGESEPGEPIYLYNPDSQHFMPLKRIYQ